MEARDLAETYSTGRVPSQYSLSTNCKLNPSTNNNDFIYFEADFVSLKHFLETLFQFVLFRKGENQVSYSMKLLVTLIAVVCGYFNQYADILNGLDYERRMAQLSRFCPSAKLNQIADSGISSKNLSHHLQSIGYDNNGAERIILKAKSASEALGKLTMSPERKFFLSDHARQIGIAREGSKWIFVVVSAGSTDCVLPVDSMCAFDSQDHKLIQNRVLNVWDKLNGGSFDTLVTSLISEISRK